MDKWGNLYGTTIYGGANSTTNMTNPPFGSGYAGTVWELSPNASKTNWTYRVLYSFCAQGGAGCTDGRGPQSGVILGPDGRLYGSTSEGGAQNSNCRNGACGTIFELTPNADRSVWTHKLLSTSSASRAAQSAPTAATLTRVCASLLAAFSATRTWAAAPTATKLEEPRGRQREATCSC